MSFPIWRGLLSFITAYCILFRTTFVSNLSGSASITAYCIPFRTTSFSKSTSNMKFSTSILSAIMAVAALATPTPVAIEKRATTMCGSFKTLATHGYTVYQNNWGAASATSGSQCTTLNSVSSALSFSWSTSWTWAGGKESVKSFSNIALEHVNKKLTDIKTIPSTWTWK